MRLADVTVVILTRNEAANIQAALAALPADCPRVVYDAESSDGTAALARAAGARVVVAPWTNFRDARAAALTLSATPWTLMLDADERPDAELLAAIAAADGACAGYRMRRGNHFCGRLIVGGAWANEFVLRLARTARARVIGKDGGTVHESIAVDGAVGALAGRIDHYSYASLAAYREKFARYTDIEAREAAGVPARRLARAWPAAFAQFFLRGGWRDGWRGAFIAGASAVYPFVVAYKAARARA